ncbi:hypothetical protein BTVI_55645 [Pitangus sulphuratus]|nr:hypothetical protein BTVI_55645 [Pitangus sulphuratus]
MSGDVSCLAAESYICQNGICFPVSFYLFDFHFLSAAFSAYLYIKIAVDLCWKKVSCTLKGSRGKLRFAWLELQIVLIMTRAKERKMSGNRADDTQISAEKEGEGFRLQKADKKERGISFEPPDDMPDQRMYRTEEGKPKCPEKKTSILKKTVSLTDMCVTGPGNISILTLHGKRQKYGHLPILPCGESASEETMPSLEPQHSHPSFEETNLGPFFLSHLQWVIL